MPRTGVPDGVAIWRRQHITCDNGPEITAAPAAGPLLVADRVPSSVPFRVKHGSDDIGIPGAETRRASALNMELLLRADGAFGLRMQ